LQSAANGQFRVHNHAPYLHFVRHARHAPAAERTVSSP
jgi:hypothetical protein